jgi:hypothetical protein
MSQTTPKFESPFSHLGSDIFHDSSSQIKRTVRSIHKKIVNTDPIHLNRGRDERNQRAKFHRDNPLPGETPKHSGTPSRVIPNEDLHKRFEAARSPYNLRSKA